MSFRDNLKSELKYHDMQLKELSKKTGINVNTLGNYLTGHHSLPNIEVAVKIAKALDVTVEYLVTGDIGIPGIKNPSQKMRNLINEISKLDEVDQDSLSALVDAMKKRY